MRIRGASKGLPTSAYVIADVQLTGNAEELAEYRSKVVATLEPYGGRFLARGGELEVVEGGWAPGPLVLVEFPELAAARAWNEGVEEHSCQIVR